MTTELKWYTRKCLFNMKDGINIGKEKQKRHETRGKQIAK